MEVSLPEEAREGLACRLCLVTLEGRLGTMAPWGCSGGLRAAGVLGLIGMYTQGRIRVNTPCVRHTHT